MTAGRITDDTEQAVLLASELIDGHGEVDIQSWADALIAWEESMKAKGRSTFSDRRPSAPSTPSWRGAIRRGWSSGRHQRCGDAHHTVAIAVRSLDLDELVTRVALASRLTHNTSVALAGAAAVAGAVSAGVEGLTFE